MCRGKVVKNQHQKYEGRFFLANYDLFFCLENRTIGPNKFGFGQDVAAAGMKAFWHCFLPKERLENSINYVE